jgi:hypothetical protein
MAFKGKGHIRCKIVTDSKITEQVTSSNYFGFNVLSRDRLIIDGIWIGNRIYWTLTTRNYN